MANNGSLAAKAIEHLQSLEDGVRLSSEDLAAAIGYEGASLSQCLAGARRRGELDAERAGRGFVWFLPQAQDNTPVEFSASLWLDGDLVIYGAQEMDDGGVLLTKDQLAQIKRMVAWSPAP